MHKDLQIFKANDVIEYKLSKLIHSFPRIPPGYPKSFINLSFHQILFTPATKDTYIRSTVKKRKIPIAKHQMKCQPSQNAEQ